MVEVLMEVQDSFRSRFDHFFWPKKWKKWPTCAHFFGRKKLHFARATSCHNGSCSWSSIALLVKFFSPNASVKLLGRLLKKVSDCDCLDGAIGPRDRMHGHFWPPASQGVIGVNRSKNIKNHSFRPQQGHTSLVILFIFKVHYLTWYSSMLWQS